MKIDRLDHDRIDTLRYDVFRLRNLVLRVIFRGLNDNRITGSLGGLLEERHVRVEVTERRLLFEHKSDFVGFARGASVAGYCWNRDKQSTCQRRSRRNPNPSYA
jgi:hypothetical protein